MKTIPRYNDLYQFIFRISYRDNGERIRYKFPNGYGASVIHTDNSYGIELTIIDPTGLMVNDSNTFDYLTKESLYEVLIDIKNIKN